MTMIVTPASKSEIREVVREAKAHSSTIEICGGHSRRGLGGPVQAAIDMSLGEFRGIELYEPGALTMIAKAGTPVRQIDEVLAENRQQLPFEPIDHRHLMGNTGEPTIGGVVACNASGSRRIQSGGCRDCVLGLSFVDGNGAWVKSGGRVMKNVTGYDLVKLLCGSHGTLGVLTEIAFKVLPRPEHSVTLQLHGLTDIVGIKALSAALGSPYEITAAAHIPGDPNTAITAIRIDGFGEQIKYRVAKLRAVLRGFGDVDLIDGERNRQFWRKVTDVAYFSGEHGDVWRISSKPTDGPRIVESLRSTIECRHYYDLGGGLVWLLVDQNQGSQVENVRHAVKKFGGHATLVRASDATRSSVAVFEPEHPRIVEISRKIKHSFDPVGILNPGRISAFGSN